MTNHDHRLRMGRRRPYKRLLLLPVLLVLAALLAQHIPTISASADYGDSDDAPAGNSGQSSQSDTLVSSSEQIYDAAVLQQEVETSEHQRNSAKAEEEEEEAQTETQSREQLNAKTEATQMASNISKTEMATMERRMDISMGSEEEEEHYDDENLSMEAQLRSTTTMRTNSGGGSGVATTMIPEYVRKGKAENFPSMLSGASEEMVIDPNVSYSSSSIDDYLENDASAPHLPHQHSQHHQSTKQQNLDMPQQKLSSDADEPLAMKLYQNNAVSIPDDAMAMPMVQEEEEDRERHDATDEMEDNKLKEPLTPISLPQQQQHHHQNHHHQLLPLLQERRKQFLQHQQRNSTASSSFSEEEYANDAAEEEDYLSGERGEEEVQRRKTTSAPMVTMSPSASGQQQQPQLPPRPDFVVSRAAFPGFAAWAPTTDRPAPAAAATAPTKTASPTIAPTTPATVTRPTAAAASAAVITTTGLSESSPAITAATTTMRPGGKQGKQIKNITTRRKLLPHEQLRNYIEDAYIRMPLAVIVDPSSASLEKTKALWRDALRTNLNIKIVLVSLNASGVPAAYNFNNTRQFLAGLNSIKEHDGGNAFIGIVTASELVPYDSAVFISTAEIPPHTELVQDAAITLLKKRIRLYLIWYGERALSENETQDAVGGILGEVAIRSGGEILHIVGSENSQELEGSTLTLVADAFRGSQEVEIPVDTTLSSLHVKIDAPMRTATLETPNGDINLKKLVKFKSHIMTLGVDDHRLDAFVPLTKIRKATVFKLKVIPDDLEHEYVVFVRADRKADLFLDDMIKRFDTFFMEGFSSSYPARFRNSRLQSITSALAAASIPTHDNLKFPEDNETSNEIGHSAPKSEVETFSGVEIHKNPIRVDATKGAAAANVTNQRSVNVLQRGVTKIEMGLNSQVLVAPGMLAQLQFEVTNTRSEPVFHNIQVVDERRFLQRLVPQSVFIRAGETASVSVTVLVPSGTPQGTIDRITFTCHGGETASLSLNLKVITTADAQDTTPPAVDWTFGSRCEYLAADASNCGDRFWTLDVTAQDWQTGIMRLQSTPTGLISRNSYTVGSTEPLRATYLATCCEPRVSLIAYDIAGNQRSQNIDVRDLILTEASIAAIALGALLLLLLIVLLVVGIVWCCRRRKVTLDLPTYRSHSTRGME